MEGQRQAIEALLEERRVFPPPAAFRERARVSDESLYAEAEADPVGFWMSRALSELTWYREPTQALDDSNPPFFKWFADGELNASVNCLDRHLAAGGGDKTAYIWVGEPGDERVISYRELHDEVNRLANVLRDLGVKQGRPRRDLPRHGARAADGAPGLRAHRRRALGDLRRLLGAVARRAHQRRRVRGADHGRRRLAQGRDRAAQGGRRRGAGRLPDDRARARRAPHRARDRLGRGPRPLVPRPRSRGRRLVRARAHERRGPALPALHLGHDRQAEGHRAHDGRLPARHEGHARARLRHPRRRRLLVHRRHRLGHRALLHRLRAAPEPHDRRDLRGRARASVVEPALGDRAEAQGHDLLHGADRDPRARRRGRRPSRGLRPLQPAPARHGRRADQPRGLDLVPRPRRRRALPDRRHLVADRDGLDPDRAAAGRDRHQARLGDGAAARHRGRDRQRAGRHRAARRRRLPRAQAAVAVDAADVLRRGRALRRDLLVALRAARLLHGRRRQDRRGRLLLAARPRRRRDQRGRPPHLDDRGRVGARLAPGRRRGGRDRRPRRRSRARASPPS